MCLNIFFFFQAEDGIRDKLVTGVQTCALPIYFPELRIVCGHIGWPWTEEMIAVAWKHRNVWIDTSAHVPRHYPPAFVHFLKTFGRDKVCFATDYPLLPWERVLKEVEALELPPEV